MAENSTTFDQVELLERKDRNDEAALVMALVFRAKLLSHTPPLEGIVQYLPAIEHCSFVDQAGARRNAVTGFIFKICLLAFFLGVLLVILVWLIGQGDLMFDPSGNGAIQFGLKVVGASLAAMLLLLATRVFAKTRSWNCLIELPETMRDELQSIYNQGKAAKQAVDSGGEARGFKDGFKKSFTEDMAGKIVGLVVPEPLANLGMSLVADGDSRSIGRTKEQIDAMAKAALDVKIREWADRLAGGTGQSER
jgi:hypothetical protein